MGLHISTLAFLLDAVTTKPDVSIRTEERRAVPYLPEWIVGRLCIAAARFFAPLGILSPVNRISRVLRPWASRVRCSRITHFVAAAPRAIEQVISIMAPEYRGPLDADLLSLGSVPIAKSAVNKTDGNLCMPRASVSPARRFIYSGRLTLRSAHVQGRPKRMQ
jgi:hypothetical protein